MAKKIKRICVLVCSFILFLCCFGCQNLSHPLKNDRIYVILTKAEGIETEKNLCVIPRGEDATFTFTLSDGYVLEENAQNQQYEIEQEGEGYAVTIPNVFYDTRVTIEAGRIDGKIFYYVNGGSFLEEKDKGKDFFMQDAVLKNHLRLNTDIGSRIEREGHTLLGWNTEPDGSGQHIGLGSRVTVPEEDSLILYAEWEAWSPKEWFSYTANYITKEPGDIVLTKYLGGQNVERLSIPSEIDGKKVTYIDEDFSSGLSIDTLIFPNTMHTVEIGAFRKSNVKEIYFFDNLVDISNGTFDGTIPTVHINAIEKPRYMGESDNSHFADNMDRLILNADKKKMIFFAGCSMSYGLFSPMVEEAFDEEYTICNMGVIGGTNGWFQFLCMLPYIGEGDVFIHAPEEMSSYQLLHKLRAEQRMFVCVESNYDLLANIDVSRIGAFFDCFAQYNEIRLIMETTSYDAHNVNYNEYGDIVMERPNSADDADYELDPLFDMRFVSEEAFKNLNDIYGRMRDQGATVFFSFAPLNKNALSDTDKETEIWSLFEEKIRKGLDEDFKVISSVLDYLMEGKYFYDSDYHLSNEGAILRTQLLVRDIKNAMGRS